MLVMFSSFGKLYKNVHSLIFISFSLALKKKIFILLETDTSHLDNAKILHLNYFIEEEKI